MLYLRQKSGYKKIFFCRLRVRGDTRGRDTGRFALPRKACRAGARRVLAGCGTSGRTGGFAGLGGSGRVEACCAPGGWGTVSAGQFAAGTGQSAGVSGFLNFFVNWEMLIY